MNRRTVTSMLLALLTCVLTSDGCHREPPLNPGAMSFFITSVGSGDGGNLGGIEGADAHCQALAAAAGAGGRQWRAYLSAPATASHPGVNARNRIGQGPWFNARGAQVAANLRDLHPTQTCWVGNNHSPSTDPGQLEHPRHLDGLDTRRIARGNGLRRDVLRLDQHARRPPDGWPSQSHGRG